jgi:hypothetical protein
MLADHMMMLGSLLIVVRRTGLANTSISVDAYG